MRSAAIALTALLASLSAVPAHADQPRIVYESWANSNPDVWVMNADGSDQHALTINPAIDGAPMWSPDGSRVAFMSSRGGNADIYTMGSDGTDVRRLTKNGAFNGYPVWGPTGLIAFTSNKSVSNGTSEIWVMNPDGTGQTRLTANDGNDAYPAWTPDGHLLFTSSLLIAARAGASVGEDLEIYRMRADGSEVERLTDNLCNDQAPSSSPDGAKIAFVTDCGRPFGGVSVMNADGSGVRALTTNGNYENWPTWSPDGTKIAFSSDTTGGLVGNGDVVVMNADGSAPHRLTRTVDTFEGLPAFSPQGAFDEIGRGHITVGNVMADTRTMTVLGASAERAGAPGPDQGIDGFFLPAPPAGTRIGTATTDHGGAGYVLNLNFHDVSGAWLGNCSPGWFVGSGLPHLEVRNCAVPPRAAAVEVSADHGIDLDVVVRREPF